MRKRWRVVLQTGRSEVDAALAAAVNPHSRSFWTRWGAEREADALNKLPKSRLVPDLLEKWEYTVERTN